MLEATARANSNIAFIKYWGNQNDELRLPMNSSISMNLDGLYTETRVRWDESLASDVLVLNGETIPPGSILERVSQHLEHIRKKLPLDYFAQVESSNTFPTGAGIASSASAFAALTAAAIHAGKGIIDEREMSILARLGSGSASRSVPDGHVAWYAAKTHHESYAESIAPIDHWDIVDVVTIISDRHKAVTSRRGHESALTSDLQIARVEGAQTRFDVCKQALLDRNFDTFAQVVEEDSNLMHAVMMTSKPPLFYWLPASLTIMQKVRELRSDGVQVCYTLDAGPNVHCLCTQAYADQVKQAMSEIQDVIDIRVASPGQGVRVV